jgi:hypothetical protein
VTGAARPGVGAGLCLLLLLLDAGCTTAPSAPPAPAVEIDVIPEVAAPVASPPAPRPAPVAIESPPFEPVASPPPAVSASPAASPPVASTATEAAPATPPAGVAAIAPGPAAPVAVVVPVAEPSDEQLMAAVVGDLQRYAQLSADELRRELTAVTQALARQRSDAHRVRLAVLYTMTRTAQDDQRALQLLENVAKSGPGSPAIKQLAVVLQVQVTERVRAVREEQQKADAAVQKLEALRAMERSLLRDRVRSGGGGGGGGGSGGGN